MKAKNFQPIIILFFLSVFFCLPILSDISLWGQMDWDQFTFWNAVPRDTILRYGQFPLWNPYVNGGNVLLAHPHSPFLSPMFLFVLIFGPIIGLKIEIIVHLWIGLTGMFYLAKHLRMHKPAAYLSAFIFMLSSIYPLHLTEGHTSWLPMAFMPWVFLFFIRSFKKASAILWTILFMGLIILGGSIDVLLIFIFFLTTFSLFKSIQLRTGKPIISLMLIFLGSFLICGIKLIPMVDFLKDFPPPLENLFDYYFQTNFLSAVKTIFLDRGQMYLDQLSWSLPVQRGRVIFGWHEYGSYVGLIPLVLFVLGCFHKFTKKWPVILTAIVCFGIAVHDAFFINLFQFLKYLPFYDSFNTSSRFLVGVTFVLALMAGFGLDFLDMNLKRYAHQIRPSLIRCVLVCITLFVLGDLISVNSSIFRNAFVIESVDVTRDKHFKQKYHYVNFFEDYTSDDNLNEQYSHSSQYPIFLSNHGILNSYEIVAIHQGDVRTTSDANYRGEVYIAEGAGHINRVQFTPNRIDIKAYLAQKSIIVVNQNYYKGWRVRVDGALKDAFRHNNLIATHVPPGNHHIVFSYQPDIVSWGAAASIIMIIIWIFAYRRLKNTPTDEILKNHKFLYPAYFTIGLLLISMIMNQSKKIIPSQKSPDEAVFSYREKLSNTQTHDIDLLRKTLYLQKKHTDYRVRFNIAEVLGELDDPDVLEELWSITQSQDHPSIREAAVEGMCLHNDNAAFPYLKTLLSDPQKQIRKKTIECFDHFGDESVLDVLQKAYMAESQKDVRLLIAIVLVHLGDDNKLTSILESLANDPSVENRILITEYLLDRPVAVRPEQIAAIYANEKHPLVKIKMARMLGNLGDTQGIPFLKNVLIREGDPHLRTAAAWALVDQRHGSYREFVYPYLLKLLKNEDWELREKIVEILDNYDDYSLTPLLADLLKNDPHPVIREIAAWLMGERKDPVALDVLEKGLYDSSSDVRTGVLAALYKILKANQE